MARTETLRLASEHVASLRKLDCNTKWSESGARQTLASKVGRERKAGEEELRLLGGELKVRRRMKLKEFYEEQDWAYDLELKEMGLAMIKARV